ncbi:hypothetical protein [Cupriavidus agavae]|uniref:Uncharacterized protein n=1 Tax=Cupriavidus agavae TaxID=1001822 RepID=A0A4Q7S7K4_9BURK|nr:hypothetical protein [Cupriavidus agavae]RZT42386.1 hypothetical protein EV147_1417 [Cupriavidus agavae]
MSDTQARIQKLSPQQAMAVVGGKRQMFKTFEGCRSRYAQCKKDSKTGQWYANTPGK